MHIKILYFAQLAELAQKTEETRNLQAGKTVAQSMLSSNRPTNSPMNLRRFKWHAITNSPHITLYYSQETRWPSCLQWRADK